MIGLGPCSGGISDSEAQEHADRWGGTHVHPSAAAYRKMAEDIVADLANDAARYTNLVCNPLRPVSKRPRLDISLQRDKWVSGCLAALPRRDSVPGTTGQRAWGKMPYRHHKAVHGRGQVHGRGWPFRSGPGSWGRRGCW
jgi:hypothetical protein